MKVKLHFPRKQCIKVKPWFGATTHPYVLQEFDMLVCVHLKPWFSTTTNPYSLKEFVILPFCPFHESVTVFSMKTVYESKTVVRYNY